MNITFRVTGLPKAQPRPRAFARRLGGQWRARVYDAGTAEAWKSLIAAEVRPLLPATPLDGPIELNVTYYFPRPKSHLNSKGECKPSAPIRHTGKPDLDNLTKAVKDCLTQIGLWRDDGQVCRTTQEKVYSLKPGAYVSVTNLSTREGAP